MHSPIPMRIKPPNHSIYSLFSLLLSILYNQICKYIN